MSTEPFSTSLDPDHYFQGLARQNLDFHAALGELIDNAFSARRVGIAGMAEPLLVEITVEQQEDGNVMLQVADHGIGIPLSDIKSKIFNIGGQGSFRGAMNEHGFGLKNALALLTGGNKTSFCLITRSESDHLGSDDFLRVDGPLSTNMSVRTNATRSEWADGLFILGPAATGTKVRVQVSWAYLRTVFRKGNSGLDVLMARLGEHLGVMHRYYIDKGCKIKLSYKAVRGQWIHKDVPAIHVPFDGSCTVLERSIEADGVTHNFTYKRGVLDYSVKDPEAEGERGWPYPLRIYYQGANARCGIDIVVRDRVIKTGVFEEIWDEAKTVDFNRFTGELKVGQDFKTTNNKTGLDPHAENWEKLLDKLSDDQEFTPQKATRSDSEKSLRDRLAHILRGTFPGAGVAPERRVWGGGISIDIFVDGGDANCRIYELKVTSGRIVDLYQLLAGWDGLVKEGVHPSNGILVVKDYPQTLRDAVDAINSKRDAAGNKYSIELRTVKELVPD